MMTLKYKLDTYDDIQEYEWFCSCRESVFYILYTGNTRNMTAKIGITKQCVTKLSND